MSKPGLKFLATALLLRRQADKSFDWLCVTIFLTTLVTIALVVFFVMQHQSPT